MSKNQPSEPTIEEQIAWVSSDIRRPRPDWSAQEREYDAMLRGLLSTLRAREVQSWELAEARIEIKRLKKENFALAANQCREGYSDEWGNHRCRFEDRLHTSGKDAMEVADHALGNMPDCLRLALERAGMDDKDYPIIRKWFASAIESTRAEVEARFPPLVEALKDAMAGLRYVREHYHDERTATGDLYGVGFDRVEEQGKAALAALEKGNQR